MATRRGTAADDQLTGTNGADVIRGLGGDDTIDPLLGADEIDGGDGDDVVVFTSVLVSSPPPEVRGTIIGGRGFDTIDLRDIAPTSIGVADDHLAISVGSQGFTISGVERILFGGRDDYISLPYFTSGLEVHAGGGADFLLGRGDNRLFGEAGDDVMFVSAASPDVPGGTVDGGDGLDTLGLNIALTIDLAEGTARSGDGVFSVASFERVSAMSDSIVRGDDLANEFFVADIFDKADASVRFEGRGGADVLSGSQGRDTIDGGDGADRIRGSGGADVLTGAAGPDLFLYDADDSTPTEHDRITDFKAGSDRIDFTAIDADPATTAFDRLQYIGRDAFSGDGGELRFAIVGRGTFVEVDLDGDRSAELSIELDGRIKLTKASFILVPTSANEVTHHDAAPPTPLHAPGFDIP